MASYRIDVWWSDLTHVWEWRVLRNGDQVAHGWSPFKWWAKRAASYAALDHRWSEKRDSRKAKGNESYEVEL